MESFSKGCDIRLEWEEEVKEIWHPEFDYILEEINRLFEKEKEKIENKGKRGKTKRKKRNLELIRIYLPEKEFKLLEKYRPFRELHNLGGIPCSMIKEDKIRIDVEVVNPRKRKRKAIIYVKEMRK